VTLPGAGALRPAHQDGETTDRLDAVTGGGPAVVTAGLAEVLGSVCQLWSMWLTRSRQKRTALPQHQRFRCSLSVKSETDDHLYFSISCFPREPAETI